tara:strand:+ start:814 stop:1281 length:468 start_codon:yes stop_codon:yes gene_type:complete
MTKDRREYYKKYREANKEKLAAQAKAYYKANKEKIAPKMKAWQEANKDKVAAHSKAWKERNKEKNAAYLKAYQESKKNGFYIVYLLPKHNYVGMSSGLVYRLRNHKSLGRDVSDVQILGKYKTKQEARAIEDSYHKKGYLGAYGNAGITKKAGYD